MKNTLSFILEVVAICAMVAGSFATVFPVPLCVLGLVGQRLLYGVWDLNWFGSLKIWGQVMLDGYGVFMLCSMLNARLHGRTYTRDWGKFCQKG